MMEKSEQGERARIKIYSKCFQSIGKVTADIVRVAKDMELSVSPGPVGLRTSTRHIKTRLFPPHPDENKTDRYGSFMLRVHWGYVDVFSSTELVEQIVSGFDVCDVRIVVTAFNPRCRKMHVQGPIGARLSPLGSVEKPIEDEQFQWTRIKISSKCFKSIDKVTADIVGIAKDIGVRVWGPVRMPEKLLNIKTSLAPLADGKITDLYGNSTMLLYERFIDVSTSTDMVEHIVSDYNERVVEIVVTALNQKNQKSHVKGPIDASGSD